MMKLTLLLSLFLSICSLSYSQQSDFLDLRYSNVLSDKIAVHTIYLNETLDLNADDNLPIVLEDKKISAILKELKEVEGVSQASYDQSTQTITVVATPKAEIESKVVMLNQTLSSNE